MKVTEILVGGIEGEIGTVKLDDGTMMHWEPSSGTLVNSANEFIRDISPFDQDDPLANWENGPEILNISWDAWSQEDQDRWEIHQGKYTGPLI